MLESHSWDSMDLMSYGTEPIMKEPKREEKKERERNRNASVLYAGYCGFLMKSERIE